MKQKFIPLTEEQLVSAEKGQLKLKFRNGEKVNWFKRVRLHYEDSERVFATEENNTLRTHYADGKVHRHETDPYDIFIDEEETAKLKQNNVARDKCSPVSAGLFDRLPPSQTAFNEPVNLSIKELGNKMNPLLAHTIEQLNKPVANPVQVIGNAFTELLEQMKENTELNLNGGDSVNENTAVHRQVKSLFDDVKPKCSYGGQLRNVPDGTDQKHIDRPAPVNFLLERMKHNTEKMVSIAEKKNHDYGGTEADPFRNFKAVEDIGVCGAERGILVRMTDKLCRISSLIDKAGKVSDESIEDTLIDLANYALILEALIVYKKQKDGTCNN